MIAPAATAADDDRQGRIGTSGVAPAADIFTTVDGSETVPDAFFVQFKSQPVSLGGTLSSIESERSRFLTDADKAEASLEVTSEYESLWNGVAISTDEENLEALATSPVVEAIYPIGIVEAPETTSLDPQMFTAKTMTGADIAQSELGLTGEGVRVGIIDSGVDYNHPDLGGSGEPGGDTFPTTRVTHGWDFVGDDFNASIDDKANYDPYPQPDARPDDCNGHGTHVAGIVGANGEVTGVAPGVTFGAYRVFGCNGSTTSEIMLHAMEQALADDMDVVNMSIGSAFSAWAEYPTSRAADALVAEGVHVAVSIGNSGADGLQSASAPGAARDVIGVGSVENLESLARYFVYGDTEVPYMVGSPAPEPPSSGDAQVAAFAEPGTPASLGCSPLTAEQADRVEGNVGLVSRGECTFHIKAANLQAAGATGVVIYNNAPGIFAASVAGDPAITVPVVGIDRDMGLDIAADSWAAQAPVTITWAADEIQAPNPSAGLMSSFSSFGFTADLRVKPDVSAPGGLIYAPYPLEQGGYATLSGTSMAAPHVAGAVALMLEAEPTLQTEEVRTRLQNTADPVPLSIAPTAAAEVVHRQGAGMVQVDQAILADTQVNPGLVQLGQTPVGSTRTVSVQVQNTSPLAKTYAVTTEEAAETWGVKSPVGYYLGSQTVDAPSTLTVPAGRSATLTFDVTVPADATTRFGGFVVLTDEEGVPTHVTYGGYAGDLQDEELLLGAGLYHLVECDNVVGPNCYDPNGVWEESEAGHTYSMVDGDFPTLAFYFDHQVRTMTWDVYEADGDGSRGDLVGRAASLDYLGKSTALSPNAWDGTVQVATGGYAPVPDGSYIVEATLTKARAFNDDRPAGTESWASPAFEIDRGEGAHLSPEVSRVLGKDRFQVSAAIAMESWEAADVDTVYVASGRVFADALAGSAVAGHQEAPILLTRPDRVDPATAMALRDLKPERIVILGGERTVTRTVATALKAYAPSVSRLGGDDRYHLAGNLAAEYPAGLDVVFLASGEVFSDALSASALAADLGSPVLLTRGTTLSPHAAAQIERIDPAVVVVVGGPRTIHDDVLGEIEALGTDVDRVGGEDRYAVSAAIAGMFEGPVARTYVASGNVFSDALSISPVAAMNGAPVYLTKQESVPEPVLASILDLTPRSITIAGGYASVAQDVQELLEGVRYE